MKKKTAICSLLVISLTVIIILGLNQFKQIKRADTLANRPPSTNPVKTLVLTQQDWQPFVQTTGLISSDSTGLAIQASGVVANIAVTSGQSVKKGDLILSLDNTVEEANLNALQAQYNYYKRTYDRYVQLAKTASVSKTDLDKAEYEYKNIANALASEKANINRRKIFAPFDGKLGIINAVEGQFVSLGQQIVNIEDLGDKKIKFFLPQENIAQLHYQQALHIELENPTENRLTLQQLIEQPSSSQHSHNIESCQAYVSNIDNGLDTQTGLIAVEGVIKCDKQPSPFTDGMFAKVKIALPTIPNQFVLPQVAVAYALSGETLYILQDIEQDDRYKTQLSDAFKAKRVAVTTLDRQGNLALVVPNHQDALKAGDKVIVSGMQRLSDGSYVREEALTDVIIGADEPAHKTRL
ncbi:efflux RND transporter periplasmic adaptor subunit [Lonepinella koalarum]|uniref:efflux RND transporter periplasmic adaptor subunit n=1 Tax=Lonepinella koalarum TaxID=53417 RepID=UPI003F6E2A0B